MAVAKRILKVLTKRMAASVPGPREAAGFRADTELAAILLRERYRILTRSVPYLYVFVAVTTIALTYVTYASTYALGTLIVPTALMLLMAARFRYWIRARSAADAEGEAKMLRDVRGAVMLGPGIVILFSFASAISLSATGEATNGLVLAMIWITSIASAFCVSALPKAAATMVIASSSTIVVCFLSRHEQASTVLALVVAFVSAVVLIVLKESSSSFHELIRSRLMLDIRRRASEEAERRATELANTDVLTGLANRRRFESIIREKAAAGTSFGVALIDLDGFKPVNDVYGHPAGDVVLKQFATRLSQAVPGASIIARIGGDEFAIISEGVSNATQASALGDRIRGLTDAPFPLEHGAVRIDCTQGYAFHPTSSTSPTDLIRAADAALCRAKSEARGSIGLYDASTAKAGLQRARVEQALRKAIAEGAIEPHFQPIVDLESERILGYEALARWTDPELGPIGPNIFIPIAEQIGLIGQLSDSLLRKAATVAAGWPEPLYLSFNLSARHFSRPAVGSAIARILEEAGLPARRFEAEVTDSEVLRDLAAARNILLALRKAGARVALDDFGTGFSGLSQIRDLPLDKIKIDKSFVDRICVDAKSAALVHAIVDMGRRLGLNCVAEGIETRAQATELRLGGCAAGQGYLFAKPQSAAEVARQLIAAQNHVGLSAAAS